MTFWKCHVTQDFKEFALTYCYDHINTLNLDKTLFHSALQLLRMDLMWTVLYDVNF